MEITRTIDEIDLQILNILQEKARIPNAEVSRQVGMAPSAVLERIRKLEERGIIEGYEVRLNPAAFSQGLAAFLFIEESSEPRRVRRTSYLIIPRSSSFRMRSSTADGAIPTWRNTSALGMRAFS